MKNRILNEIKESKSILLLTHENPDGDAIGSVLSFYHYLTSINKTVDMIIIDMPRIFDFLPSINKAVDTTNTEYDLGIVLDCSTEQRIGQKENIFSKCKKTICIDHHIRNTGYCDINFIEGNISSCCQVIYYLFKEWNIAISKEIGEALISGVLTDTNGFSNDNVDEKTYALASDILRLGVNIHDIYDKVLCKKSLAQYELMKIAMDRLEFLCDGKVAFTYILKQDCIAVGAVNGDHEGIVNIGRNIQGVEVSIFLREDVGFTVSIRSSGSVNVDEIARTIGGGGHLMAAGGTFDGTLQETKEKIIDETKKVLSRL